MGCSITGIVGLPLAVIALAVPYGSGVVRGLMVAMGIFGFALSLYQVRATFVVHSIRMGVSDEGFYLARGDRVLSIPWAKIQFGRLHIRQNWSSRTDKMLVISYESRQVSCHPSVLTLDDEEEFLARVRRHLPLEEVYSTPAP